MRHIPTNVDEYLAALPADQREALEDLRRTISAVVPGAQEAIRSGAPAVRYGGKTVVGFGAAKNHISLYVMYGSALETLKEELEPYETSSTVIRFRPDKPLPASLVERIVAIRLKEINDKK